LGVQHQCLTVSSQFVLSERRSWHRGARAMSRPCLRPTARVGATPALSGGLLLHRRARAGLAGRKFWFLHPLLPAAVLLLASESGCRRVLSGNHIKAEFEVGVWRVLEAAVLPYLEC